MSTPEQKSAMVHELFADFVERLQAHAPQSVSRTAQIIPFPIRHFKANEVQEAIISLLIGYVGRSSWQSMCEVFARNFPQDCSPTLFAEVMRRAALKA
jgi:hypothetical protein